MGEPDKNSTSFSARSASGGAHDPAREADSRTIDPLGEQVSALESARRWVVHHPLPALLGTFAFGAFIGLMKRD